MAKLLLVSEDEGTKIFQNFGAVYPSIRLKVPELNSYENIIAHSNNNNNNNNNIIIISLVVHHCHLEVDKQH